MSEEKPKPNDLRVVSTMNLNGEIEYFVEQGVLGISAGPDWGFDMIWIKLFGPYVSKGEAFSSLDNFMRRRNHLVDRKLDANRYGTRVETRDA